MIQLLQYHQQPRHRDGLFTNNIVNLNLWPSSRHWLIQDRRLWSMTLDITRGAPSARNPSRQYIRVAEDKSAMSLSDFWTSMKQNWLVWLLRLKWWRPQRTWWRPHSIRDLPYDPFRSLSDDAKNEGAYEEVAVPYLQLYWANYFRPRIPMEKVRTVVSRIYFN